LANLKKEMQVSAEARAETNAKAAAQKAAAEKAAAQKAAADAKVVILANIGPSVCSVRVEQTSHRGSH
jgi:hypothetical protein